MFPKHVNENFWFFARKLIVCFLSNFDCVHFFCVQSSRLEEQRSELPQPNITMDVENGEPSNRRAPASNIGATVPDEDFFSLIMRVQGGRMEDQRAAVREEFLFFQIIFIIFLLFIFQVPFPPINRNRK